MSDFAKEPAPDATGKCGGLVTVGNISEECLSELKQMLCGEIHPCNDIGDVTDADIELVTRSQAEELLVAERAENAELKRDRRFKQHVIDGLVVDKENIKADNVALTARVKELEELLRISESCNHFADNLSKEMRPLEAKLAAAEEVAQLVIQAEEDKSGDPNLYILLMQTAYDKARAALGGKPS